MPPLSTADSESRDGDDVPRRFRNVHVGNDLGIQRRADPFQYENVHVLLFCWEEDNSGGWDEMKTLADVFGPGFGYNVNCYRIPNNRPNQWVKQTLRDFKHFTLSPNNLAIVYFHGHSNFKDRVRLRSYPRSYASELDQEIDLSGIMTSLKSMGSDVLFLLQTCWAGGILSPVEETRIGALDLPQNRVEIVTSSGYEGNFAATQYQLILFSASQGIMVSHRIRAERNLQHSSALPRYLSSPSRYQF
jgi:hypothetical protein